MTGPRDKRFASEEYLKKGFSLSVKIEIQAQIQFAEMLDKRRGQRKAHERRIAVVEGFAGTIEDNRL